MTRSEDVYLQVGRSSDMHWRNTGRAGSDEAKPAPCMLHVRWPSKQALVEHWTPQV
jgi:hypothetical protein